jgi:hypothetical protein
MSPFYRLISEFRVCWSSDLDSFTYLSTLARLDLARLLEIRTKTVASTFKFETRLSKNLDGIYKDRLKILRWAKIGS